MKKGIIIGMVIMTIVVIALGAIYDYCPSIARVIWPDLAKFKETPIYEGNIFSEELVGSIPMNYKETHVCALLDEGVEPYRFTGWFTYDFDVDRWIYCQ